MVKFLLACTFFGLLLLGSANASDPRVIRLVVPFSAGSAQDIFARLISDPLGQQLHARVLVVNKPGAGGTIGSAFVAHSKPDGQTVLLAASSHHLSGALHPNLTYHPLHSFQAAAFLGTSTNVLLVTEDLKVHNVGTFVSLVRSSPNALNYASSGHGSVTHLGMASFLSRAGIEMVHLPLNGTNEVIREILAGRVHAAMVPALSLEGLKANSNIRLLAVADATPSAHFPNLPTLSESGYPGFSWEAWVGLLVPRGTSEGKIQEINQAVLKVISASDMKRRFEKLGISSHSMPLEQFQNRLLHDWLQALSAVRIIPLN